MIHEKFVISAINIRRKFLKVSSSLDVYHLKAKSLVDGLNEAVKKLENLDEVLKNGHKVGKKLSEKEAINELLKIINDIEDEGKSIEKLTEPVNKEIERLALEEQELYQQIKKSHPNLSDKQIVGFISKKLKEEGLS